MYTDTELSCAFTGHRPQKLPWGNNESDPRCLRLKEELRQQVQELIQSGIRVFYCGMALGCDLFFAQTVLQAKEQEPRLQLIAVVPCRSQPDRWNKAQKAEYARILSLCDEVIVLQEAYSRGCMQKRNQYMVDRSSVLLACFNGLPSGTMNTLLYAMRKGLKTRIIDITP